MKNVGIITGASSGIGRELAIQLSKQYFLFLCGRNTNELKITANQLACKKIGYEIVSLDLNNHESISAAADFIKSKTTAVQLLCNNAGLSQRSLAAETTIDVEQHLMQVNFFGPVYFTKLLIENLRLGKAKIGITSSIVSQFGFPLRSTYSAAKHALHGYFESLALEEAVHGIKVQFHVIGRVKTQISKNAFLKNGKVYGKLDQGQKNGISAGLCAKKIINALKTNKKEILIGGNEVIMVSLKKYFPYLFYKLAAKEINHV